MRAARKKEGRRETGHIDAPGHHTDGKRTKNESGSHAEVTSRCKAVRKESAHQWAEEHA